MKLEFLMHYRADLKAPVEVGDAGYGRRVFFEVTGGSFEGPRLKGTLGTGGGDWLLQDPNGVGRLDVRATFTTHDGAQILVQYPGVLAFNDAIGAAIAGGPETQYGDAHWINQLRFETGDSRYAWLNQVVAVGEGRAVSGGVEYQVYECIGG